MRDFRRLSLADFQHGNIFLSVGVFLLVLGLFFIPEIMDLNFGIFSNSRLSNEGIELAEESLVEVEEVDRGVEYISPLQNVLMMIESGVYDNNTKRFSMNPAALNDVSLETGDTGLADDIEDPNELTWESIRESGSLEELKKVKKKANSIVEDFGKKYPFTRQALSGFIEGVDLVLKGDRGQLEPIQIPSYLAELDVHVASTMTRERVDRVTYMKWANVSVGELLGGEYSVNYKKDHRPVFNPQLTLNWVKVKQPGDSYGDWQKAGKSYVRMAGYVIGDDIKRLSLFKDGQLVKHIRVPKKASEKGTKRFKTPQIKDARAIYTIRAEGQFGDNYEKSYMFYPRVLNFRRDNRHNNGSFEMPFKKGDPRFDKLFLIKVSSNSNKQKRGFVTF